MSFSTKITFVPKDTDVKSVSFNGVDIGLVPIGGGMDVMKNVLFERFKSLHFRQILSLDGIDFVSTLTIEEFEYFYNEHVNKSSNSIQDLNQFIITKIGKTRYNWVIIEVYEWESGLE
jgi:hypothetical protein